MKSRKILFVLLLLLGTASGQSIVDTSPATSTADVTATTGGGSTGGSTISGQTGGSTTVGSTGGSAGTTQPSDGSSTIAPTGGSTYPEPVSTVAGSTNTPGSTTAGVTATTGGGSTGGSTISGQTGGSTTVGSTGGSAGTTQPSDGSSTIAPTGGSTYPEPVSTVAGSTNTPGGTTPAATLPNVTVNHVEFAFSSCDASVCTYHFDAPKNNQSFLATEESVIAEDKTHFATIQTIVNKNEAAVTQANADASKRVQALLDQLNAIQANLNTIQDNIKQITAKQQDARNRLLYVESFINSVNNSPSSCYYQRCLKPTDPPPPTTTTTPAPTTPPSPCVNFTCPEDTVTFKSCQLDAFNKPFCPNCLGNYDGYSSCTQIACSSSGTNFVFDSSTQSTTWYSTGYNTTSPDLSVIPANKNCQWNLNGSSFTVGDDFSLKCITGDVSIKVVTNDWSVSLIGSWPQYRLQAIFDDAVNPQIILTSGSSVTDGYCKLPFTVKSGSELFSRKIKSSQKTGGFFGWLLGY